MAWWMVYATDQHATLPEGQPVSRTSTDPTGRIGARTDIAAKEFALRPVDETVWDNATLDFVPIPARVFVDRVDDFFADSRIVDAALRGRDVGPITTVLQDMFGKERFRRDTESVNI